MDPCSQKGQISFKTFHLAEKLLEGHQPALPLKQFEIKRAHV